MRHSLLLALFVLSGCVTATQSITDSGSLTLEAEPWPAADALFRGDRSWLGGDCAYSIDLGNNRVLWLFGNSFIASDGARERSRSTFVRNSVAIQSGYDPSAATIAFHWNRKGSRPGSFFRREGLDWYWPGHGILLKKSLLIFLMKVGKTDAPPGYNVYGWTAVMISNPQESPDKWKMKFLVTPANDYKIIAGSGGVGSRGGYVYAFSSREPGASDIFLARWPVAAAGAGDLSTPEWWAGDQKGWVEQQRLTGMPAVVFSGGQTEFTVHEDRTTGRLIQIQSNGTDLAMRTADSLTGPWSSLKDFHHAPEADRPGALIYQGKAHPELEGAGLVTTYNVNNVDFTTVVTDSTLYYPRFLKGRFRR